MIEIFFIGVIAFGVMFYTNRVNTSKFVDDNKDIFNIFKESDYEFLLLAKYGDRVYDPQAVYMTRWRNAGIVLAITLLVFLTSVNYLYIVICFVLAFLTFKYDYFSLRSYYKKHLNEIDSLLPYYLKGLEVLIQHYTVPVALARSIDDAPEVFKPGLKETVAKIEAGDASIQPYVDFANMYPVRDSMRMMRLLYRLGLGEQEKKHTQLLSFSKSVSALQEKSRQQKYKARLDKMESMTMMMLVCTGGGGMLILMVSMFMMLANAM
ncbi:MAG: hypothetical protein VZS44_06130 [Bacilli bacterium]|nr:hypothetical protein [Bacilli bacterium]